MLTAVQIKAAKPTAKAYKLSDSHGLYLLVQPKGGKLWRYKFRLGGVEGLDALGRYPEVGLAEARQSHAESRRLVAQGINPVLARRDRKQALIQAQLVRERGSFAAVASDWCAATVHGLRKTTREQREREIRNDLLPKLKSRPIKDITRVEITALLKSVEKRAPEVARNVRNYLWCIFEYAIDTGLIVANPVPSVRVLKKRDKKNHPALPSSMIGEFIKQLDDRSRINEHTRIAMLLVMLTACRKSEVIGGKWSEVDMETGEWEIPAERMKSKRPHWIPLSSQALRLLHELRKLLPVGQELLFPNRRDPKRPMANRSLNAVMDRLGYSSIGTPHGMRAVFSTHFNGINANVDVIELCLAHAPMSKTRAAYNRHLYKVERREMLQEWADHLDLLRKS
ncbi:tyrosine-type recombinase/integrase [Novilysobacter spongiicola]|uniref:Integrase n=1 Tax=Lysobacter spongiicola DSM 21749 TaxID=1122188 RepID=A0A1T4PRG4_9GAMM|nr:integrase arm-type DNA-binding domain-containing protein [Lysobacter spongiicola]SJZ94133.1 Integrase [Lysobacter spongiicola DSM 21749]